MFIFIKLKKTNTGKTDKTSLIILIMLFICLNHILYIFQVNQPHGGCDLNHFTVGARMNNIIQPRKSEVTHQAHFLSELIIISQNSATFKGVKKFRSMKA